MRVALLVHSAATVLSGAQALTFLPITRTTRIQRQQRQRQRQQQQQQRPPERPRISCLSPYPWSSSLSTFSSSSCTFTTACRCLGMSTKSSFGECHNNNNNVDDNTNDSKSKSKNDKQDESTFTMREHNNKNDDDDDDDDDDINDSSSSSSSVWTLEQDWALIDRVPQFTIGSSSTTSQPQNNNMIRTFWTQLWISTPELSAKNNQDELCERYEWLVFQQQQKEKNEEEKDGNNDNAPTQIKKKTKNKFVTVGPSPQVLEEWSIDVTTNQVTGRLDGRTVWFMALLFGRIGGTTRNENESPQLQSLGPQPGDYVEAMGNRIYELGQPCKTASPATTMMTSSTSTTSNGGLLGMTKGSSPSPNAFGEERTTSNTNAASSSTPWMIGISSSISAFLAASVLSAAIGYGAGLGIISDSFMEVGGGGGRRATTPLPTATIKIVDDSNTPGRRASTTTGIIPREEPTVREQRARTEARVLKEERMLRGITERLSKDQVKLLELQTQERTEPSTLVFPSSSSSSSLENLQQQQQPSSPQLRQQQPSVSEKRARTEMWVLREQRDVKRLSKQLQQDQIELRQLRQQEKQQQQSQQQP